MLSDKYRKYNHYKVNKIQLNTVTNEDLPKSNSDHDLN